MLTTAKYATDHNFLYKLTYVDCAIQKYGMEKWDQEKHEVNGSQVLYFSSKPLFELVIIIILSSMMVRKEALDIMIATGHPPSISVFWLQVLCMHTNAQQYMDVC